MNDGKVAIGKLLRRWAEQMINAPPMIPRAFTDQSFAGDQVDVRCRSRMEQRLWGSCAFGRPSCLVAHIASPLDGYDG